MKNKVEAVHPGRILKNLYMEPAGIGVVELARMIGVAPSTVSRLINQKAELTCDMAMRLSKVFKRTPEAWMQNQVNYGLRQAKERYGV